MQCTLLLDGYQPTVRHVLAARCLGRSQALPEAAAVLTPPPSPPARVACDVQTVRDYVPYPRSTLVVRDALAVPSSAPRLVCPTSRLPYSHKSPLDGKLL